MRAEVVRRFLWTATLVIIACLLALTVYVGQQVSNLLLPLLGASVLVLAVAAGLTYRRVFARRAEQLRNYTERLLDPDIFD